MSTHFVDNFVLSEPAIARSRRNVYAGSIALFALITGASVELLTTLLRDRPKVDVNGKILIVALVTLIAAMWAFCVAAIGVATDRNRKWFASTAGTLSFVADPLHIGTLNMERSSIVSSEKTRRNLLIRYRSDGKRCRVALPLTWLPVGAVDEILRRIENMVRKERPSVDASTRTSG